MKLPTSSRYSMSYDTVDSEAREVSLRVAKEKKSYVTHVVRGTESFTSLAYRYLNDERLYWYIADHNPQVKYPDLIPPGTIIRIPLV